jgi:predicted metalloprotease with PDZ domain
VPGGTPPSTRLLAHELVHLWQRFDAPQWFQEGVNDYMAIRLAREADLLDDEGMLAQLSAIDSVYRAHPKRKTWSFAVEDENAPPHGPSDQYLSYRKGALVGLALDRELRLRTGGEADLAALWRDMNAQARWGRVQWSDDEIAGRAAKLAGGGVERFWGLYVEGTAMLPASTALASNLPPPAEPRLADRASAAALLQALIARIGS